MKPGPKVPQRVVDPELKTPLPFSKPLTKKPAHDEEGMLRTLVENYRVNPGPHMTMEDIKEWLEISDADLAKHLESLESSVWQVCIEPEKAFLLPW